jgi:hypothetical protein
MRLLVDKSENTFAVESVDISRNILSVWSLTIPSDNDISIPNSGTVHNCVTGFFENVLLTDDNVHENLLPTKVISLLLHCSYHLNLLKVVNTRLCTLIENHQHNQQREYHSTRR